MYRTQAVNEDGSRPDLVAETPDGRQVLAIEAKFWAGLTDARPNSYLDRLPAGRLLLFVGPERRKQLLWDEVLRRVKQSIDPLPGEPWACRTGGRTVAIVGWSELL